MLWLHRLQQRLSITRNEALTIITLSAFLVLGLSVRFYQQRAQPISPDAYEEFDRLFSQLSKDTPANTASVSAEAPHDSAGSAQHQNATPAPASAPDGLSGRPIDLNKATAAELEELPRIGPKTAERIISYRMTYGPFGSLDDLTAVKGIGPKTLALLRPHLTIAADSLSRIPH